MKQRGAVVAGWPQWVRYGAFGLLSNLLAYLLYLALLHAGTPYAVAMTGSYLSGVAMSFALHRSLTFRHRGPVAPSAVRFVLAYLAGYLLNLLGLRTLVEVWQLDPRAAQVVMVLVVAAVLFLLQRMWVFPIGAAPGGAASAQGGKTP